MIFTMIAAITIKVVSPWLAIFYLSISSRIFKQMHKVSRLANSPRAKINILPQGSKVEFHLTLQEKEKDKKSKRPRHREQSFSSQFLLQEIQKP